MTPGSSPTKHILVEYPSTPFRYPVTQIIKAEISCKINQSKTFAKRCIFLRSILKQKRVMSHFNISTSKYFNQLIYHYSPQGLLYRNCFLRHDIQRDWIYGHIYCLCFHYFVTFVPEIHIIMFRSFETLNQPCFDIPTPQNTTNIFRRHI